MPCTLGHVIHADFKRDVILWYAKPGGYVGNHLRRGFNGIGDFLAPDRVAQSRCSSVVQPDLNKRSRRPPG